MGANTALPLTSIFGLPTLSLPRSFRGPITIHSSHERIAFSPALEKRTAPISDIHGVRVYFVGDRTRSGPWGSDIDKEGTQASPDQQLDVLLVSGWHTSVWINWDGEPELPQMGDSS